MLRTVQSLAVVCVCVALLSAGAAAEQQYVLTDLGAIYDGYVGGPAGWSSLWGKSWAKDINENGEIVGTTTVEVSPGVFEYHPFFWSASGGMQAIGTMGATDGRANAINNRGQVVGYVGDKAFLWDKATGVTQDLDHLVSDPNATVGDVWARANGINDAGQVVGQSSKFTATSYENPKGAFLWDAANGMQSLDSYLPAASRAEHNSAVEINNAGQITGQGWGQASNGAGPGAYLLTPKQGASGYDYVNLCWLGAGDTTRQATSAHGLNDAGQVVGGSLDVDDHSATRKPFVWDPATQAMTNLGRNTDLGEWEIGKATDINNAGVIIGKLDNWANTPVKFGDTMTGVIWDPSANQWVRLKTITAMNGFFDIEDAAAINDHGQIVGRAVTGDPLNADDHDTYKDRAVLLSPMLPDSVLPGGQAGGYVETGAWAGRNYTTAGMPGSAIPLDKTVHLFELSLTGDFATLQMPYTDAELAAAGVDEVDLRLYWLDESCGAWVLAGDAANLTKNADANYVLGAPTSNLGDWGVDPNDNVVWANTDRASVYAAYTTAGATGVPEALSIFGDATCDGLVSAADLSLVAGNWGLAGMEWRDGDFNGDGVVGPSDLSLLADYWGHDVNGTGSAAPVPEPATLSLIALGGLCLIRRRWACSDRRGRH
jgi:hypothetical protein